MLYKSKTFELLELLDIVGFIVGIVYGPKWPFYSCCDYIGLFGTGFIQVLYLGRAPQTKETLPDFREKCRVTRHLRVFRGLTGSQQTPEKWGVTCSCRVHVSCQILPALNQTAHFLILPPFFLFNAEYNFFDLNAE